MYFTVGQKVRALDTNLVGTRIKGSIYTVLYEYTCSCGTQLIGWGPEAEITAGSIIVWKCPNCHSQINDCKYFISISTNFEPVHENGLIAAYNKIRKEMNA